MTNATAEYWDADGVSLQTLAQNIESWGSGRWTAADLRGGDTLIPYAPGEKWQRKLPGPRTITLAGWVIGINADGSVPTDQVRQFRKNWRTLRRLLWRTDRQVVLTKRWYNDANVLTSAAARVQYAGGLEPSSFSESGAKFTTDLKLAFPYFVGATVAPIPLGGLTNVNNFGDDTTRRISIVTGGAATITNNTTGRVLDIPDAATVQVHNNSTTGNWENINASGDDDEKFWFSLVRDVNSISVAGGPVTLSFDPLYL